MDRSESMSWGPSDPKHPNDPTKDPNYKATPVRSVEAWKELRLKVNSITEVGGADGLTICIVPFNHVVDEHVTVRGSKKEIDDRIAELEKDPKFRPDGATDLAGAILKASEILNNPKKTLGLTGAGSLDVLIFTDGDQTVSPPGTPTANRKVLEEVLEQMVVDAVKKFEHSHGTFLLENPNASSKVTIYAWGRRGKPEQDPVWGPIVRSGGDLNDFSKPQPSLAVLSALDFSPEIKVTRETNGKFRVDGTVWLSGAEFVAEAVVEVSLVGGESPKAKSRLTIPLTGLSRGSADFSLEFTLADIPKDQKEGQLQAEIKARVIEKRAVAGQQVLDRTPADVRKTLLLGDAPTVAITGPDGGKFRNTLDLIRGVELLEPIYLEWNDSGGTTAIDWKPISDPRLTVKLVRGNGQALPSPFVPREAFGGSQGVVMLSLRGNNDFAAADIPLSLIEFKERKLHDGPDAVLPTLRARVGVGAPRIRLEGIPVTSQEVASTERSKRITVPLAVVIPRSGASSQTLQVGLVNPPEGVSLMAAPAVMNSDGILTIPSSPEPIVISAELSPTKEKINLLLKCVAKNPGAVRIEAGGGFSEAGLLPLELLFPSIPVLDVNVKWQGKKIAIGGAESIVPGEVIEVVCEFSANPAMAGHAISHPFDRPLSLGTGITLSPKEGTVWELDASGRRTVTLALVADAKASDTDAIHPAPIRFALHNLTCDVALPALRVGSMRLLLIFGPGKTSAKTPSVCRMNINPDRPLSVPAKLELNVESPETTTAFWVEEARIEEAKRSQLRVISNLDSVKAIFAATRDSVATLDELRRNPTVEITYTGSGGWSSVRLGQPLTFELKTTNSGLLFEVPAPLELAVPGKISAGVVLIVILLVAGLVVGVVLMRRPKKSQDVETDLAQTTASEEETFSTMETSSLTSDTAEAAEITANVGSVLTIAEPDTDADTDTSEEFKMDSDVVNRDPDE